MVTSKLGLPGVPGIAEPSMSPVWNYIVCITELLTNFMFDIVVKTLSDVLSRNGLIIRV